ncbi:MAG: alpha/beta hydrolase [Bacteroidia bacterium]|nr:MAG: alpha/beta hydrolase [Bacteroidia bacterium]
MYCKKYSLVFFVFCLLQISFSQKTIEKEIAIAAHPDSLYGTLSIASKDYLCIIHAGSGPTDRNGNSEIGIECNYLKKIADSLAKNGISVFRFDKRGIGKSKDALEYEDSSTIQTYKSDLNTWINYFSNKPYKFKRIILIGHSEGALISTLVAQNNKKVKKLILISGPGFRLDTIIKRQLAYLHENAKKIIFPLIDTIASGKKVENIPPMLNMLFRESVQNYLISTLSIDPAVELEKIKIPTLIVQGTNDIQVSVDNAYRLKEHCKNCELKIIENMNHVLVDAPKDRKSNIETYSNPDLTLSKDLIHTIIKFIKK